MKNKKPRTLETCISMLVYIWLKWSDNYNKSNNTSLSLLERRQSTIRYESLQTIRYKIISEINYNFQIKLQS
jgi:hypothetical protein